MDGRKKCDEAGTVAACLVAAAELGLGDPDEWAGLGDVSGVGGVGCVGDVGNVDGEEGVGRSEKTGRGKVKWW